MKQLLVLAALVIGRVPERACAHSFPSTCPCRLTFSPTHPQNGTEDSNTSRSTTVWSQVVVIVWPRF
jgi:hypothetical protein